MSHIDTSELRWCEEGGMVLRRGDSGAWMVLDTVGKCDDIAADAAARLSTARDHQHRAEHLCEAKDDLDELRRASLGWMVAARRIIIAVGAVAAGLGVVLGRWSR